MAAYYNENDPKMAAWLRELIRRDLIARGDVDERSIEDVCPNDLTPYRQCHFFAGIGVWSYALRQAGWPDDRPVWTGSAPCQPFSQAGKKGGVDDERHLWPAWFWLISQCRPDVVFGEQVASRDGLAWLNSVQADLESAGYAIGALDLCAAGFGAPHIRQRLFFVADATGVGSPRDARVLGQVQDEGRDEGHGEPDGYLEHAGCDECGAGRPSKETGAGAVEPAGSSVAGDVGDTEQSGLAQQHWQRKALPESSGSGAWEAIVRTGPSACRGYWRDPDWVWCNDPDGPRWRPIEPGSFPLASRPPARMVRLRGYGNAIVAPVAAEFIRAYIGVRGDL